MAAGPVVIDVGGRPIKLPEPAGFVRCDGISKDWDFGMSSLLPASNRLLATFGTQADQDELGKGEVPDYSRNLNAQVTRSLETMEIGERTFSGMRAGIKAEIDKALVNLEAEMKKITEASNKMFNKNFGADAALSITDTAVLGYFEDTDSSLGFTMAMNVSAKGDSKPSRSIAACLMIPINGRGVNLYSTAPYRQESDRQEVETSVKAWRDAILAVNPKVRGPAAGFDWEKVASSAGAGAGIGLVFGFFAWISKKWKGRKTA